MYLAGYRNGRRLAGLPEARAHNLPRLAEKEPRFIELGIVEYAQGFEDGWHVRPQQVAGPLELDP